YYVPMLEPTMRLRYWKWPASPREGVASLHDGLLGSNQKLVVQETLPLPNLPLAQSTCVDTSLPSRAVVVAAVPKEYQLARRPRELKARLPTPSAELHSC